MSRTLQARGRPQEPHASAPRPLPQFERIAPYRQGRSTIAGRADVVKLSSNENCFGPGQAARDAYLRTADQLHRYPDGAQTALREAIGEVHGLDAGRIVCGNGSEELIGLLTRCYVGPGDELLLSDNHFVMCSIYGKAQGADVVLAPEKQFRADIDALIERISPATRMIALANPNNPTGTYNTIDEIDRLVAATPPDVLLLLDGAYAEYVGVDDYDPGTRWIDGRENVVMTRTFSKIHGLAGLRIGWAFGPAAVIEVANRLRTPFNTSIEALAAATAAVRDREHVRRTAEHARRWQQRLRETLGALGIYVVPSVTNFYLMHFEDLRGKSAEAAGAYLLDNGIIPRPAADDRCLRLTIGTDDENEAVIRVLTDYVND